MDIKKEVVSHVDDLDAAFQLSQDAVNVKQSPWKAGMLRLYGCLAIAFFCGCLNGYDGSLMGGLNAMSTYQDYFHMSVLLKRKKNPSHNAESVHQGIRRF
jgi:hypothetical protein